jgi:hypothetical protein
VRVFDNTTLLLFGQPPPEFFFIPAELVFSLKAVELLLQQGTGKHHNQKRQALSHPPLPS